MDKYIYDESNGLWYELQGDYYIPCLTLPAKEEQPIGLRGAMTLTLSQRVPQRYIYQSAYKRQAQRLPCED